MKAMTIAVVLSFTAGAAFAQPAPAKVCIHTRDIDHTHTVDANTVLFYMRNGTVWQNRLVGPCPSLLFSGFGFTARDTDEVCSNALGIRVIQTHDVCQLGAFTPYAPSAAGSHASP
jgi:hypothetical protein